jgi:hypothetical protein
VPVEESEEAAAPLTPLSSPVDSIPAPADTTRAIDSLRPRADTAPPTSKTPKR